MMSLFSTVFTRFTSPVFQWQLSLWLSLLVWWGLGTGLLYYWHLLLQWQWLGGCLLGGLQAFLLFVVLGKLQKKAATKTLSNRNALLAWLLVFSFLKVILVAILIIALGGAKALNSLVVFLGFLGYNCCIVFVSAVHHRSIYPIKTDVEVDS